MILGSDPVSLGTISINTSLTFNKPATGLLLDISTMTAPFKPLSKFLNLISSEFKSLTVIFNVSISSSFVFFGNQSLFSQDSNGKFTVVLDAGHGGKDPGNTGNGYLEKNIALSIALQVGKELEKQKREKQI